MEEIGEEWITNVRACRMLGLTRCVLRNSACYAYLKVNKNDNENYYLRSEIEAILKSPQRIRRIEARSVITGRRIIKSADETSDYLIIRTEAAKILAVNTSVISDYCNSGKLTIYLRDCKKKPHFFGYHEVVELSEQMRTRREARNEKRILDAEAGKQPAKSHSGHVSNLDLHHWERYMGDWLTVKQVAFMLDIARGEVLTIIKNGRLSSERRMSDWGGGRVQTFIPKAEVKALQDDPAYIKRNRNYNRLFKQKDEEKIQEQEINQEPVVIRRNTSDYFLAINNPMNPPPEDYNCGFTIAPPCGW